MVYVPSRPIGLGPDEGPVGAVVCRSVCVLLFLGRRLSRHTVRLTQWAVGLYRRAADRSKMMSMAGCLPNTKRFRHGRPDRGRC